MYMAETIFTDEFGELRQYQKEFVKKDDAIRWAKLNDGAVFNIFTGELVYDSTTIYEREE